MKRFLVLFVSLLLLMTAAANAEVADFEDLSLDAESYWNGSDGTGGFFSGNAFFNNSFTDWGGGITSWDGFSYASVTDTLSQSVDNQYSAITGVGMDGSSNYAISFVGFGDPPSVSFPEPITVSEACFTNTTYVFWSMMEGDAFAKKFGGQTGDEPDWFKLTLTGKDADGIDTGTVEFYLADYRFEDNTKDYIVDQWTWVDLSSLGEVKSLEFTLSSSDVGEWGMNTPAYFALDNLVTSPSGSSSDDGGGGGGGCFIDTVASGSIFKACTVSLAILVCGTLAGVCLSLVSVSRR